MELPPWEHHASASTLPRFNYNAASTFSSLRGFLITCVLDREKSATKEAMGFLKEYLKSPHLTVDQALKDSSANEQKSALEDQCSVEGRTFSDDTNGTSIEQSNTVQERESSSFGGKIFCLPLVRDVDAGNATEQSTENTFSGNASIIAITESSLKLVKVTSPVEDIPAGEVETNDVEIEREGETAMTSTNADYSLRVVKETFKECQASKAGGTGVNSKRSHGGHRDSSADDRSCFFFLKMAQKGVISMFLENRFSDDPVNVVSEVLEDIENGVRDPPQWCHRIVPVQESCALLRESLSAVVFKLVKQHLRESAPTEEQPLKYAIGYNRRGIEAREVEGSKTKHEHELLGRMDCIHVVAEAIAKAVPHTIVDLGAPQMVVIVEVIPLVGVQDSPVCGVAVLSGELVNVKPKLCVKPLISASHLSKKNKK